MLTVNIVLVVILLAFVVIGSRKGFVQTVCQVIGAIIAFMAARAWSPWLGVLIAKLMPTRAGLAQFIAFVIVFFLIERIIGLILGLISKVLKLVTMLPIIHSIDSLLGALLGFFEGVVFVGSSVYLILTLKLDPTLVNWLSNSVVARYTERIFSFVLGYFL